MQKLSPSPVIFGRSDVEIITRDPVYNGFFSLVKYRFRHRLYGGGMSGVVTREVLERGNAVVLMLYDVYRDQLVLTEQIRIPAYDNSATPWLLEMVAGMKEPGESDEDVARREAQEEAGLTVGRIKPVLNYLSSPGGTSERISIMVGEVDASQATGYHGLEEENEDILVRVVSRGQAYQWVEEGIIDNAASVIALQWLELHYKRLKQEWTTT
ncbi:ADP-ribose pyrophosphatase [Tatumella morbirosei]|uniref:ADP-ribose pyrophosphatase n=1 Tax=Tatumella morbirosei TaxID=642227 RepID=A0A095VJH8_9GAMM|nr:ADP-ribose diphosphatase [Tatumella morbirosei]KGD74795.1 ADP-ribose pyrophosphatase [Tatumella morbirosei]